MTKKEYRFSASQLEKWQNCALQAKYIYLDKIGEYTEGSLTVQGSALHHAIDMYHKGVGKEKAIEEYFNYWTENPPDFIHRMSPIDSLQAKGPEILKAYFEYRDIRDEVGYKLLLSEHSFKVRFGDFIISGQTDYLELTPDGETLIIGDFKSGKRQTVDNLHLNIQMSIYYWASLQKEFWTGDPNNDYYPPVENGESLWEEFKTINREVKWFDLKNCRAIDAGPRNAQDFGRLYRLLEQVQRAIDYEVFIPSINEDSCKWCDFKDICAVYKFDEDTKKGENN